MTAYLHCRISAHHTIFATFNRASVRPRVLHRGLMRRTFGKITYTERAGLDQISLTLGHSSLKTTEQYLGLAQDLREAPCDKLDF